MATHVDLRATERIELHIHLPTRTVVKVLLTLVAVWAVLRLWPQFLLLLFAQPGSRVGTHWMINESLPVEDLFRSCQRLEPE